MVYYGFSPFVTIWSSSRAQHNKTTWFLISCSFYFLKKMVRASIFCSLPSSGIYFYISVHMHAYMYACVWILFSAARLLFFIAFLPLWTIIWHDRIDLIIKEMIYIYIYIYIYINRHQNITTLLWISYNMVIFYNPCRIFLSTFWALCRKGN